MISNIHLFYSINLIGINNPKYMKNGASVYGLDNKYLPTSNREICQNVMSCMEKICVIYSGGEASHVVFDPLYKINSCQEDIYLYEKLQDLDWTILASYILIPISFVFFTTLLIVYLSCNISKGMVVNFVEIVIRCPTYLAYILYIIFICNNMNFDINFTSVDIFSKATILAFLAFEFIFTRIHLTNIIQRYNEYQELIE
ncbi:Transmembrane domain-containing protein [Orpheovirus IHUMI-LCC2]|uniref:Transmembrane domain-containing protein n=1 Tax=Orpheovirus IHUMI-LCC2 TaxID=2023057 RepID=A0A2I2L3J1_9VIRU|nr:Transmembrane domain-containing protein [Orpheovirus IHUMI-LCC2]SNW62039.1 Transmembrane domain-containing protein [Orpheovirus IHUMI-LCC2]